MSPEKRDDLSSRKRDHIRLSLERNVGFREKTTWLEHVELIHRALPEMRLEDVSTEAEFLGRRFKLPLIIEGMTGGTPEAAEINGNLAEAAERAGIPMGVGSQRAALRDPSLKPTFRIARERAPRLFLIGNIGGVQLAEEGPGLAERAVEMIEADALAIHLNSLHELVQPGGSAGFRGVLKAIQEAVERLSVPVIVKEIGCGIPRETAQILQEAGVRAIDVAGAGGTNWTMIEMLRAEEAGDEEKRGLAETFLEWGIPTAAAILEVSSAVEIDVVASGGIRNGLDAAKAFSLGADMVGLARPFLKPATESAEAVWRKIGRFALELRTAMFLTGSRSVEEAKRAPKVLLGPLLDWARQRVGNSFI